MVAAQPGQDTDILVHHRTSQFRISCQCSVRVSGHVYFRNNLHLPRLCISNDFTHVVLRIVATDRSRFAGQRIPTVGKGHAITIHPPTTNLRQTRITFDLQPPAIIVRQMEVKFVQFKHRHAVNNLKHIFLGNKITRHVQHQPTICKTRTINHVHGRYRPIDTFDW